MGGGGGRKEIKHPQLEKVMLVYGTDGSEEAVGLVEEDIFT